MNFGKIFKISRILLIFIVTVALYSCQLNSKIQKSFSQSELNQIIDIDKDDTYKLEQVLIVSRHNIRSPLPGKYSLLEQITPYKWISWTSNPGELTVKGGQLEAAMGQFFRKYLESKKLIIENWKPKKNEVRFYANSIQRTIATSKFFANGLLPIADVKIEYHKEYGQMDSFFEPITKYKNSEYEKKVQLEINQIKDNFKLDETNKDYKESVELLEKVLDFKNSKYAKDNNLMHIPLDKDGLFIVNSAVDALKLQIYEEKNLNRALFNQNLTMEEIRRICIISDISQKISLGSKTASMQTMNPIIKEIKKELNTPRRKFTFFCGHDSTLIPLIIALGIKDYELPEAISCKVPIGCKLLFEKYRNAEGTLYIKLSMCYNTLEQIRECSIMSLDNPPMFYGLEFNGLNKNKDGYYYYDDVIDRFDDVMSQYHNENFMKNRD